MTDQEINEAVARKLGNGHIQDGWEKVCVIPNYVGSIGAAWEIVESFKGNEFSLAYDLDSNDPLAGPIWSCVVWPGGQKGYGMKADTAPMAICLVFLEWSKK